MCHLKGKNEIQAEINVVIICQNSNFVSLSTSKLYKNMALFLTDT